MKQEKGTISAVGSALTLMIETIIMRMLQPMKEQINQIKNDMILINDKLLADIRSDLRDTKRKVADIFGTMQHQLTDMISNIEVEAQTELMMRVNELSSKLLNIGDSMLQMKIFSNETRSIIDDLNTDIQSVIEDCATHESTIECNEILIGQIVSKLGLIGEVLNE